MERIIRWLALASMVSVQVQAQISITGTVRNTDDREAMPFVNVYQAGTTRGVTTDASGNFSISLPNWSGQLIASHLGFVSDTVNLRSGTTRYFFSLKPEASTLQEVVVVSGTMREVSKMDSPIPVEIYSPALFMKNPTPSIFESLNMINGVQPQLNCNVCNTGDIHINGMEGPYTMVLIDGMPIVSSLSTVYGLSGIPNSMVKRIEVVKGPASTLYGSEAVAGIINIITREPGTSPRFKTDVSATSYGEYNVDVSTRFKVSNADALLGINYFNFSNRYDINGDNFTDVTLQDRVSVFNKWNIVRPSLKPATIAFRYVYESRWGGEMNWSRAYRGSDEVYGESIFTNRGELIGTYGLPVKNESLSFDYSYNFHIQDSYYGVTPYLADQQVAFAQLRWDKTLGNHQLLMGLPFRYIRYDDNTPGTAAADGIQNRPMQTYLPGIFVQDEWKLHSRLTWLNGFRYDHHNEHGNIFSPRLSLKYAPNARNTFRLSGGNGFRVVNLFTEDHAALTGARQVIIQNELKPEQSWNVNLNYATQWSHRRGYVGLDASAFYTYFTNKIVGDFLTDPELILYDNLAGHAISKGLTLNADVSFTSGFKMMAGVTAMEVYQVEEQDSERKIPQLFAPQFSGTYAFSYALDQLGLSFDLTGRFTGPMYLPVVPNDYRPEQSPWFTIVNLQTTKVWPNGFEVYAGVKNLLNFLPSNPLLRPFDPFDKNITINNPNGYTFDTSYNYAPIQGIRGFVGLRYTFN